MFPFSDNNPTRRVAVVTYTIIAINLVVFLWMWWLPPATLTTVLVERGFIPARIAQLTDPNKVVVVQDPGRKALPEAQQEDLEVEGAIRLPADRPQILFSLFTCMFLHGGWMHVIGNMWFLFIFGNNVEDRLGHVTFGLFYLAGGLLATAAHWVTGPSSTLPVIGAGGAVAAVLGGYAITFPHARVRTLIFLFVFVTVTELPAWIVLGVWFLGQLLEGLGEQRLNLSGGVAWWAHVGGFAAGAAIMPVLRALVDDQPLPNADPRIEREHWTDRFS